MMLIRTQRFSKENQNERKANEETTGKFTLLFNSTTSLQPYGNY